MAQHFRLGLMFGLPVLLVIYAVVMGTAALLNQLGDPTGALALRWVGTVTAMIFSADVILMVLLLSIDQWRRDEPNP